MADSSTFYVVRPFAINDDTFVSSNVAETDFAAWNSGATYSVLGERVIVVGADIHRIYENINATGNTNKNPLTEPTFWVYVSMTNRWKMFDDSNTSQTVNADSINVKVDSVSRPNSVFLGNVVCTDIEIIQRDSLGNIVFQDTYQMYENTGIPSYFNWLFSQRQSKIDLFVADLLPYAGGSIEVTLNNLGQDVKCATMLIGYADGVGLTELGASISIQDFSVKRVNDFGDSEILERPFSREGDFNVFVENSNIDRLVNLLASRRATATLYVGSSTYACTYIYGFYDDFNNVIKYPEQSLLNIQIKGLS
jgi:hypothetical protein